MLSNIAKMSSITHLKASGQWDDVDIIPTNNEIVDDRNFRQYLSQNTDKYERSMFTQWINASGQTHTRL